MVDIFEKNFNKNNLFYNNNYKKLNTLQPLFDQKVKIILMTKIINKKR